MIVGLFTFLVGIPTEVKAQNNQPLKSEQYIVDESLVNQFRLELFELRNSKKMDVEVELVTNKHNKHLTDTIRTYNFKKSIVCEYSTSYKSWIYKAVIYDKEIILLNDIQIGMSILDMANTLNINIDAEVIDIGDVEQNRVFSFVFINNKLSSITYNEYLD